jgi:hypothetical protein
MRIGQPAVAWYQAEIERLGRSGPIEDWAAFDRDFLAGGKG